MSSEIIVVLVMVALAIGGLVVLERNSRRNKAEKNESDYKE
jgi:flagellar basal body-associated protein FliL